MSSKEIGPINKFDKKKTTEFLSPKNELLTSEQENMSPLPINGLLYPVDMDDRRVIEAFKFVVNKVISEMGGAPVKIETVVVEDPFFGRLIPRMIFSFKSDHISEEQLKLLEEVSRRAYGDDIRSTKNKQGKSASTHLYPKPEARGKEKGTAETTIGWYFGRDNGVPNRTYKGLFVYREIGKRDIASGLKARNDGEWFTQKDLYDNTGNKYKGSSYLVEVREGGMYVSSGGRAIDGPYQTDLAEMIIYTSLVLAGKDLPAAKPGLTYDIYHEMNQIGLGAATELPGLEEPVELVERTLIIPLASPELTRSLGGNSKSVGLIGQVGTGKTQVIKHFLRQKLGIMMVPVNAAEFEAELNTRPENRRIIPRIRDVADKVGRSVVLVIEDLENLAHRDNPSSKNLLNELAGLYNSGYRVLWTTNHPEVFNHQLLEPERLGGKMVFCGLPNPEARKLILNQHLVEASKYKKLPLFDPEYTCDSIVDTAQDAREMILYVLSLATNGFTPRYLKDIVIEAIDQFMYRISREIGQIYELTEDHLENMAFSKDDWGNALAEVRKVYDVNGRLEEDARLQKFIRPGTDGKKGKLGFPIGEEDNTPAQISANGHHKVLLSLEVGED